MFWNLRLQKEIQARILRKFVLILKPEGGGRSCQIQVNAFAEDRHPRARSFDLSFEIKRATVIESDVNCDGFAGLELAGRRCIVAYQLEFVLLIGARKARRIEMQAVHFK